MEFGVWSLEFGVWSLEFGVYSLEFIVYSTPDWEYQSKKPNITKKDTAMNMRNISIEYCLLYF